MVFKSAVDWWFYAVVVISGLLIVVSIWPVFVHGGLVSISIGITTLALGLGLPLWLLFGTHYRLDNQYLHIHCGPLRWRVPLAEIESIQPSRSFLSSPALSLDRLSITYSKGKQVLISPADKAGFLRLLGRVE